MSVEFKNKSMNFFYQMMTIRFEQSIDNAKRVDMKQLKIFLWNETARVIFIYALTEYVKKRFDEYVMEYGDGSEKLAEVNMAIVERAFYKHFEEEILQSWKKMLANV